MSAVRVGSHSDPTHTALIYTTSPLHYLLCIHPPRPVTLFLLVLPLPRHIPSKYKYTETSQPELFFLHLPRKMEPIEGSETSAFKPQTLGKYPKENILHNEHGESLKSRHINFLDQSPSFHVFQKYVLCWHQNNEQFTALNSQRCTKQWLSVRSH